MKKIFLGSDHGGYELKQRIIQHLQKKGYDIEDVGWYSEESVDYPVFGAEVGRNVSEHDDALGIVVCGSGVGISIAANKIHGIRCALVNSCEVAKLSREHNDANVLALGGRTKFVDAPLKIVDVFLETKADEGERHKKRRRMLDVLQS